MCPAFVAMYSLEFQVFESQTPLLAQSLSHLHDLRIYLFILCFMMSRYTINTSIARDAQLRRDESNGDS